MLCECVGVHVGARLWPLRATPWPPDIAAGLCSSRNTPGSDGSICSGGSALRGSAPDSLTSHHAFAFSAVVLALHQQNLPSDELGSSLKTFPR